MKIRFVPAALGILSLVFAVCLFQLSISQPLLYLTGKVVTGTSGQPVSSVWVELFKQGDRVSRSLTGTDGRYYISGLKRGSYEVVVIRHGREACRQELMLEENRHLDIKI